MDGLLFDTETLYQQAAIAVAQRGGYDIGSEFIFSLVGLPHHHVRNRLLDHLGDVRPVDDFLAAWVEQFWLIADRGLRLKPGAIELLDALDELRLPRAIATSSSHRTVQHHLAAHDLTGRFHAIVGAGDYVAGKPAPDPFLKAAEQLGAEPSACLALEDSHNGVRSAAAAGMMTVMVPDLLEPTDEICALCTLVAADLHEVRRILTTMAPLARDVAAAAPGKARRAARR